VPWSSCSATSGSPGAIVFYESLPPHVARREEMDRVLHHGLRPRLPGGRAAPGLNLLWIQRPPPSDTRRRDAIRLSFLSAALWWLVFLDPAPDAGPGAPQRGRRPRPLRLGSAFGRLRRTFGELRSHPDAFLMLCAFLVYNDGINTIIRMATSYGTEVGIAGATSSWPSSWCRRWASPSRCFFGALAGGSGPQRDPPVPGGLRRDRRGRVSMTSAAHFYLLAFWWGPSREAARPSPRSL